MVVNYMQTVFRVPYCRIESFITHNYCSDKVCYWYNVQQRPITANRPKPAANPCGLVQGFLPPLEGIICPLLF